MAQDHHRADAGGLRLGVFGFKFIEKQFFPDSNRPELMVEMWMPEGTTFAANEAQVEEVRSVPAQAARTSRA